MAARKPKAAPKRPVGRPAHKPTDATRMKVTMLLSAGMTEELIAINLRIAPKTLRLRYATEMRTGLADRRAEVVELLFGAARKGNTAAIKHLDGITSAAAAESAFVVQAEAPTKAPRLGKKEQAAIDADSAGAGTDWAGDLGTIPPEAAKTAH